MGVNGTMYRARMHLVTKTDVNANINQTPTATNASATLSKPGAPNSLGCASFTYVPLKSILILPVELGRAHVED